MTQDRDAQDQEVQDKQAADTVDPKLLEILVCPQTKGPLAFDREKAELVSKQARLAYPVRDGVPIMLIDEARALSDEEAAAG